MNQKWYQSTGWIIVLLILFFPVGLFLVWKSDWKKQNKIIITIVTVIFVAAAYDNMPKTSEPKKVVEEKADPKKEVVKETEKKEVKKEKTTPKKKEVVKETLTPDEAKLNEIIKMVYFGNYKTKDKAVIEGYDGKDKRINLLLEAKSVKEDLDLKLATDFIKNVFTDIQYVEEIYIGMLENGNKKISIQIDKKTYESVDWSSFNPEDLPNLLGEKYYFQN